MTFNEAVQQPYPAFMTWVLETLIESNAPEIDYPFLLNTMSAMYQKYHSRTRCPYRSFP